MYRYYISKQGRIFETESFEKNGMITVVDPTDNELKELAERFDIDYNKISAATDLEEPSRWEKDGETTYLIVDVPYKNEEGYFDTIPLMVVLNKHGTVVICEKSTGTVRRFLEKPGKNIDLENRLEFEIRLLNAVTKEYQQDLKEIDGRRREIEKKIKNKAEDEDVYVLHDLENSLVYFITSLKGCSAIIDLMWSDKDELINEELGNLLKVVRIEAKQSVEMATVYKEILGSTRELLSTEINVRLNVTMRILAAFTMILTVPMVVTGAYGMNVDLPIQNSHWAFGTIIAGTLIFTGVLGVILRKKHLL